MQPPYFYTPGGVYWSIAAAAIGLFHADISVCVRALSDGHYWSQKNIKGVVAKLLDTVSKHRFV